jgi:hypothetical protein
MTMSTRHVCVGECVHGCDDGRWDEPDWGSENNLNEAPVPLTATVTISGLTAGSSYALLRFDEASALPSRGGFLTARWSRKVVFVAAGAWMRVALPEPIQSDGTYFYRCVAAPATRYACAECATAM